MVRDLFSEETRLTIFPVLAEDVRQEDTLYKLRGKKSAPRMLPPRELGYGITATEDSRPLWLPDAPHLNTIATLAKWTLAQSENVRLAVLSYLDDPSEQALEEVVKLLPEKTPKPARTRRPRRAVSAKKGLSVTELILRALPTTKEALYEHIRTEHQAKRPEATVRQSLRNLLRAGRIVVNGQGVYETTTSTIREEDSE